LPQKLPRQLIQPVILVFSTEKAVPQQGNKTDSKGHKAKEGLARRVGPKTDALDQAQKADLLVQKEGQLMVTDRRARMGKGLTVIDHLVQMGKDLMVTDLRVQKGKGLTVIVRRVQKDKGLTVTVRHAPMDKGLSATDRRVQTVHEARAAPAEAHCKAADAALPQAAQEEAPQALQDLAHPAAAREQADPTLKKASLLRMIESPNGAAAHKPAAPKKTKMNAKKTIWAKAVIPAKGAGLSLFM